MGIFDTPTLRSSVTLRSVSDEGSWAIIAEKAMVLPKGRARFLTVAIKRGLGNRGQGDKIDVLSCMVDLSALMPVFVASVWNDGIGIWRYQRSIVD